MPPAARILQASSGNSHTDDSSEPVSLDSDVVVILAALLCALICVVGLALVARCAWLRRWSPSAARGGRDSEAFPAAAPPPSSGLKKKALKALPKVSYATAAAEAEAGGPRLSDCAICLAEFEEGDEVRILPQCGHGFHSGCVDTWLGAHSSCPSCRRVLVVTAAVPTAPAAAAQPARCHHCGASSTEAASSAAATAAECGAKEREDGNPDRFLP